MAVHKLYIDEFDEIDYRLIAIHTTYEGYRLAYFLNKFLPINLKMHHSDILIKSSEGESHFMRFVYKDEKKDIFWNLLQNCSDVVSTSKVKTQGLFDMTDDFSSKIYLLPELRKVDFFLKIENADENIDIPDIIAKIKKIDKVNTVYPLEADKIKSKNNLIF